MQKSIVFFFSILHSWKESNTKARKVNEREREWERGREELEERNF